MKKKKKIILSVLMPILALAALYGISFYFSFFQGFVTIKDGKINSSLLPDKKFQSSYVSKTNFSDIPYEIIDDINISILDNKIIGQDILLKSQRYYIPLKTVAEILDYSFLDNEDIIIVSKGNDVFKFSQTNCNINNVNYSLRGNLLKHNNIDYICISDIERIFEMIAKFNFTTKEVKLYSTNFRINSSPSQPSEGKIAMIRLEDVSAGGSMLYEDSQIKFKAMSQFLYSQGIKYHIAWVPKYACPSDNIDNNLLTINNIQNSAFINMLDYFINTGAEIGLHGYTHQSGDETSLNGTELSRNINNSEKEVRSVVENSVDTANALNIPYSFFESSHYKATSSQKDIIKEYVQFLYEPKNYIIYNKLQKDGDNLFVPTPLGYVRDLDVSYILKELEKPRYGELCSLFYHPTKELDFINYNFYNNEFNVDYSKESPLQQIVTSIKDNKYVTIHIDQLINN